MNRFFDTTGDVSLQVSPWALEARGLSPKTALFVLHKEIHFRSTIAGGTIIVPTGFMSDLASIPQFAWSLFMAPDDPRMELASWVHDYLYGVRGQVMGRALSRADCDRILTDEGMVDLGASPWQRTVVKLALRLFGKGHWGVKQR
jgi:hypothetical protein